MAKKMPPHKLRFAVLATDVVLFAVYGKKLHVLLSKVDPELYSQNYRALVGGLIHPSENAEEAAQRHLMDKGGIDKPAYMEQLYTFSNVNRDPRGRVVSTAYLALIPHERMEEKTLEAEWHPVNKLPKLAYDHKEILNTAIERLQGKLEYTNIAFGLLPTEFTLSELRGVYEVILKKKLDKRNFQRKIFELDILKPLDKKKKGGAHRPARLYSFKTRKLKVVELL